MLSEVMNGFSIKCTIEVYQKFLKYYRYTIFVIFYLFCFYFVLVSTTDFPFRIRIFCGIAELIVAILSWQKTSWALNGFFVAIPLVNGLQVMGIISNIPILSLTFSMIYLSWFTKHTLWEKKSIIPLSPVGNLVDALAGIAFFSLIIGLWQYPTDIVLSRFRSFASLGQADFFWSVNAGQILLQGLFYYRLLEMETSGAWHRQKILWIFYLQAIIIICFSLFQYIFHIPKLYRSNIGVFLPFDDIHSYGSYIVFLLFLFLFLFDTTKRQSKFVHITLFGFFLLWAFLSFSRATWVAVLLIGMTACIYRLPRKKSLLLILGFFLALAYINIFPSNVFKSDNDVVERIRKLVLIGNSKDIAPTRWVLWNRAIKICKEYPLTGSGIGTYGRVSPLFSDPKNSDIQNINAHNYFLQFASELGLPAFVVFLSIIIYVLSRLFLRSVSSTLSGSLQRGVVFGLSAYLITLMSGHALLLPHQQFLFWFVVASATIPDRQANGANSFKKLSGWSPIFAGIIAAILVIGYLGRLSSHDIRLREYEQGFYSYEDWDGEKMHWTMGKTGSRLVFGSDLFGYKVVAMPFNSKEPEGLNSSFSSTTSCWMKKTFLMVGHNVSIIIFHLSRTRKLP